MADHIAFITHACAEDTQCFKFRFVSCSSFAFCGSWVRISTETPYITVKVRHGFPQTPQANIGKVSRFLP
jgi:hypothetical protein